MIKNRVIIGKTQSLALLLSSGIVITSPTYANNNSSLETAGDIITLLIPAAAYGSTYSMEDKEGREQFYYAFATNLAATYTLKAAVDKQRPDNSDNNSFPSGHTSIAFQGASFIHKRYGFEYSIPAYIGASFVGYSRIQADKHDLSDVLAGAALGVASSLLFTKSYSDTLVVAPNLASNYYGLTVRYQF